MKLEKNILIRKDDTILRVLFIRTDTAFVIDCIKQTMPVWKSVSGLEDFERITEDDLLAETNAELSAENKLTQAQMAKAHARYSMIAPRASCPG